MQSKPRSRHDGLIVKEVDNEVLIYDTCNNRAHCLNHTAALIWKRCDGRATPAEISESLSNELQTRIDESVVWFALKQFTKDQLLAEQIAIPPTFSSGLNRREMVRVLGLAAVVAVPVVTSIIAPSAAQAATCFAPGQPCSTPAQCCSGICGGGSPVTSGIVVCG